MTSDIPKNHFSYIFIDECGSAKEISSLVPIVGVGIHEGRITASIVLAGDPKQLGPVVSYDYLTDTTHSVSLLERIADKGLYAKNPLTGEYDPNVITLLRNNFRSHPALLELPNRMFYAGQLRAKASPDKTHWAVGWDRLPNRAFPLIFHPVVGEMKQDENSSSMYNEQEAEQVLSYVETIMNDGICGKKLEQTAIGIITPYASQVRYLKDLLRMRGWKDIEVGSTEQYQGREKRIMLMSTVRTGSKSVGFLANTKRLNVSLTRAQALMIVVGDLETLRNNRHWAKFIGYCRQNNALLQSVMDFAENTLADFSIKNRINNQVETAKTRTSDCKYSQPNNYTIKNTTEPCSAQTINQTAVNSIESFKEQAISFLLMLAAVIFLLYLFLIFLRDICNL
uniref:Helicase MOV-10 n=1 Tax=Culex pipiens TaxID=7175 RepID=A0A8D8BLQ8_CULPI